MKEGNNFAVIMTTLVAIGASTYVSYEVAKSGLEEILKTCGGITDVACVQPIVARVAGVDTMIGFQAGLGTIGVLKHTSRRRE